MEDEVLTAPSNREIDGQRITLSINQKVGLFLCGEDKDAKNAYLRGLTAAANERAAAEKVAVAPTNAEGAQESQGTEEGIVERTPDSSMAQV